MMDQLVQQLTSNFAEEYKKYQAKKPSKIAEYFQLKGVANFKKIKLKDDSILLGVLKDGSVNGPAIANYSINKTVYIGEMQQNQRHGFGYRSYTDPNLFYAGDYKSDLKCGKGKLWNVQKQMWIFDGNWDRDLRNGYGVLIKDEGTYEGNWVDDKMEGNGKMKWLNGDEYEGEFHQDLRHGYGVIRFANGDVYKGEFRRGVIHGKGVYLWKNGEKYDGNFTEGVMDGQGRLDYAPVQCVAQGSFITGSDKNMMYALAKK